jgi:glutamate--cysteine ligase catalytic subunit
VRLNPETREVYALCKAEEILSRLKELPSQDQVIFHPEYGRFMVETTPGKPYGGFTTDIPLVESNMLLRRQLIQSVFLHDSDRLLSMASFPLLGVGRHTYPAEPIGGPVTQSLYVPDTIMNQHPR